MSRDPETTVRVAFTLNDKEVVAEVESQSVLLHVLRSEFGCRGVRASCERGVCGACTVLLDGSPVASCNTFAFEADGCAVETVEGLAGPDGTLSPEQQGFRECGGFQCGYCTSGMLMLTRGLLRHDPAPDRETIRDWVSSNTCRCTGYQMIVDSVARAAELSQDARSQS